MPPRIDLKKRSEKSHVAGQIRIKVHFSRLDQSESIPTHNYHELFDILASKILVATRQDPELAVKGQIFLDEFGKRYGVRGFYRVTKFVALLLVHLFLTSADKSTTTTLFKQINRRLSLLVEEGNRGSESSYDFKSIEGAVRHVVGILSRPEKIKLTVFESNLWTTAGKTLYADFIATLNHFRDFFPFGKPEGDLKALLNTLQTFPRDRLFQSELEIEEKDFDQLVLAHVKASFFEKKWK